MKHLFINIACAVLAVASTSMFKFVVTGRLLWKGNTSKFTSDILSIMKMHQAWLAIILFIFSQVLWFYILATQKLSIAYPLQVALSIILFTAVAHYFFKETIQMKQIMAFCLIFLGIILLKT